ncbi:arrestin domain protein [Oesophagostomum dentatum]|uniref:Arrestin domain protein n=1 Tax=Oesophagostomum dentatum TaxID=61180 RepID=A0A0B1TS93_OESDE|nr:arrestin domain protein [Oesophagostomum dentatum]
MDYISSFDIRLAKDIYYAGERISGNVLLENTENIKIKGIRVLLRGKVHATLKVVKSGERRTIKDDQYVLDEKLLIWGKDKNEDSDVVPILARGMHQFPFAFDLPQSTLPCSLESRHGTIRYYIKVIIDIPYASSPQGIKYFTIIGPHIDCMEEKYLGALSGQDRKTTCCWCCRRGALALRVVLDRTAYVCGENIRIRAQKVSDFCANHVEGGKYVSPEFRLGQVYDGEINEEGREEEVVLYRPVYAKIAERRVGSPPTTKDLRSGSFTRIADSSQSMITESNGRRRSIIINSPVMGEQRDIKLQSQLSLKIEGEEDVTNPLIHKKA